MHFCEATIAILGDHNQTVRRDRFKPVSWPELRVIQAVHGEESVTDVKPFTWVDQKPSDEKFRIGMLYGEIVDRLYPGGNPNMTMDSPGNVKIVPDLDWLNPITNDHEKTRMAPTTPAPRG